MGAFFKSFWSQMGHSTGKRVSNSLFGDKWATPYRVAVNKSKDRTNNSSRRNRSRKRSEYSETDYTENRRSSKSSKSGNHRWLYWFAGFILFAGTYDTVLHPTKDNIVLIVMLWIVAIVYLIIKK